MIHSSFLYEKISSPKEIKVVDTPTTKKQKKKGEDIVCAAVSTATLLTYNAIEHLKTQPLG